MAACWLAFPAGSAAGFGDSTSGAPTPWEGGGDLEHVLCLFSRVLEMTHPTPGPIPCPMAQSILLLPQFPSGQGAYLGLACWKGPTTVLQARDSARVLSLGVLLHSLPCVLPPVVKSPPRLLPSSPGCLFQEALQDNSTAQYCHPLELGLLTPTLKPLCPHPQTHKRTQMHAQQTSWGQLIPEAPSSPLKFSKCAQACPPRPALPTASPSPAPMPQRQPCYLGWGHLMS